MSGSSGSSDCKESACSVGDLGSVPGLEDPLEEDPTPGHSPVWQPTPVFLPGESPWTEESGRLWSMGLQRVRQDKESEIYMSVFINNRFLLY